jgi:hypothetical protein
MWLCGRIHLLVLVGCDCELYGSGLKRPWPILGQYPCVRLEGLGN